MGAHCYLHLPGDAEPSKVSEFLAILLRAPTEFVPISDKSSGRILHIHGQPGVRRGSPLLLGSWELDIGDDAKDFLERNWPDEALHFSPTLAAHTSVEGRTILQMTLPSRPFFIALAAKVASWFGGSVVPNSDRERETLEFERSCPSDSRGGIPYRGRSLHEYQNAIVSLRPITEEDLNRYGQLAARG